MKKIVPLLSLLLAAKGFSFCGFYVAKADASLFNKASQVILVRNENKTAITMFSDYKGELKEFAIVVPVPELLTREQINVADRALVERVDAFSAPRLVEYFDDDPCAPHWRKQLEMGRAAAPQAAPMNAKAPNAAALGVTIEAQYTVGEYDILILSAKESKGLQTWLEGNGYKIPKKAANALEPYIKQKTKFFVAKVNLEAQAKSGFTYLRPIQFAFESPKFMLPLRLGMANADGPQDMLIYAITKKGRVETTNYRTVKLPSEQNIPLYIKNEFPDFYRAVFDVAHKKESEKVVFLEYAWNMSWCDPCAAEPLKPEELRKIGVFWLEDSKDNLPTNSRKFLNPSVMTGPVQAFISRLHVRYDAEHFPEDLFFQETADDQNFQGRYVLNHPWKGEMKCEQAKSYLEGLKTRRSQEAKNLASLTNWPMESILKKMEASPDEKEEVKKDKKWFHNIFK